MSFLATLLEYLQQRQKSQDETSTQQRLSNSTNAQVSSPVNTFLKRLPFLLNYSKDSLKGFVKTQLYDRLSSFHKMYNKAIC